MTTDLRQFVHTVNRNLRGTGDVSGFSLSDAEADSVANEMSRRGYSLSTDPLILRNVVKSLFSQYQSEEAVHPERTPRNPMTPHDFVQTHPESDARPWKIHRDKKGKPRWFQRWLEAYWVVTGKWSLHRAWQRGCEYGTACEYRRTVINGGR